MTGRAVLLDLWDTLGWIGRDTIASARRRGAELAGAAPSCLAERWSETVERRSVAAMGPPREELRQLLRRCGCRAEEGVLDEILRLEADAWRHGMRVYDDVLPTLAALRRDGWRLAIVSNCSWQTGGVVEATGLAAAVDAVVLSFEVGLMKPDPAILRLALDRLGADPARSVLVDDISANLDAARALGLATLLMDRENAAPAPDHPVVRDLAEAAAALV